MSTGITDILQRLRAARRHDDAMHALKGMFLSLAIILGAVLFLLGLEAALWLGMTWRTVLCGGLVTGAVALVAWLTGVPAARRWGILPGESDLHTAGRVGHVYPEVHDRLLNAVQLAQQRSATDGYYSAELIDASLDETSRDVASADFSAIVDRNAVRAARRICTAVLVTCALASALMPRTLGEAAYRCVHFRQAFSPPAQFTLQVEPGNRDVVKGESVDVIVHVTGARPGGMDLLLRPEGQVTSDRRPLHPLADGTYRYHLEGLRLSTAYQAHAEGIESDEYLLRVLDRPSMTSLQIHLAFPRYAGLPPRDLDENLGDITALAGTTARISLTAGKPLAGALLRFSDSTQQQLQFDGSSAEGTMIVRKDRTYHVEITDREGLRNIDPIEYTVHVIPDLPPTVAITSPGTNLNVAGNEHLPVVFRVTDDYGISRLRLAHKLIHSRYEQAAEDFTSVDIPVPQTAGTEWIVPFAWDLASLRLSPEDVVEYHAEVFDNDDVGGPKSGRSESFILRLPSIEEVFAEADKGHEATQSDLAQALQQAQDARKDLDDLARQMKNQQQKPTWDEQKKAEELTKRYQEIQKKVDDVQHMVGKMLEELQKNRVLSPETLQKYQEMQQLMEQMNSPEFAEAMKRLQESLQQMSPEALKQALQQFQFSEEQFRKSIERTVNLLKRIQVEQKVDEMVKRAEALQKSQDELRENLAQHPPADKNAAEEQARAQHDLQDKAGAMERELKELEKKMQEFPAEMPVREMQDLQSTLEKSEMDAAMQQSTEQIRQGDYQQAQQRQQKASQALGDLKHGLQQMKQTMMQNQQKQVVQEMERATKDLLEISKREEDLKNESRGLDPTSQQFRENAQQQMEAMRDLGNVTGRLSLLSQKTFSISPEMGKSIGEAMHNMDRAMESLEQRNGNQASQQQGAAMGGLNQTAAQLQEAIQGMMQGGGQGMGMPGFMQRLQQLSGMQQGINDATQGLTPQQAAEMGRLAGEQGMVRKSLEDLAREANRSGDLSKLLGDLNRIAQDMREVQTDLAQGNVNPETLHKQERILSRMLDAQRSMRERDYEKRRKSETGVDVARQGPLNLDPSTPEGRSKLQQDLLRALEEGYSRDYEELIRKYFDALQKQER
jgi:hypothetical protein